MEFSFHEKSTLELMWILTMLVKDDIAEFVSFCFFVLNTVFIILIS